MKKNFQKSLSHFIQKKEDHLSLGLYLVKELVRNYGGKIKIYSKKGEGTKVKISLPL
ncbi:MAG: ATP-binding protein [Candidatus Hydrothermales bacterium]